MVANDHEGELKQILSRLQPASAQLSVQEVVLIGDQPSLGRQWGAEETESEWVCVPLLDVISEPDEAIIASFTEFVCSESTKGGWFTFLTSEGRVVAIARCEAGDLRPPELKQLRRLLVVQATSLIVAVSPVSRPFFAVLKGDGTPRTTSGEAPSDWAVPGLLERLSKGCRRLAATGQASTLVPGYLVKLRRLHGGDTDDILASFDPVGFATTPQLAMVSPTQGRVVRYAAAGATAPEIARAMKRSAGTVRTHLREAYRRLDVASRMELMACSNELTGWGAR